MRRAGGGCKGVARRRTGGRRGRAPASPARPPVRRGPVRAAEQSAGRRAGLRRWLRRASQAGQPGRLMAERLRRDPALTPRSPVQRLGLCDHEEIGRGCGVVTGFRAVVSAARSGRLCRLFLRARSGGGVRMPRRQPHRMPVRVMRVAPEGSAARTARAVPDRSAVRGTCPSRRAGPPRAGAGPSQAKTDQPVARESRSSAAVPCFELPWRSRPGDQTAIEAVFGTTARMPPPTPLLPGKPTR